MSDGRFAATASEEAEKINAQAGPGPFGMELVTDQEFWERQGIRTGEELALSVLSQEYSDLHKEIHGVRPRHERHTSVEDVQAAISRLESSSSQGIDDEEETIKVSDIEPDDQVDDFESMPHQTGMGRRMENKNMSVTKSQLVTMVREEIEDLKNEGWLSGLFGGGNEEPAAPTYTHSSDNPKLDLTPEDKQEAQNMGFVHPGDTSMEQYHGYKRYREWVDSGRPERHMEEGQGGSLSMMAGRQIPETVQTPYELLNYFEKQLSSHDWGHEYSDDPSVSRAGRGSTSHLNQVQALLNQFGLGEPAQQAYDRYEREAREGRAPGDLPKFFFEDSDSKF